MFPCRKSYLTEVCNLEPGCLDVLFEPQEAGTKSAASSFKGLNKSSSKTTTNRPIQDTSDVQQLATKRELQVVL